MGRSTRKSRAQAGAKPGGQGRTSTGRLRGHGKASAALEAIRARLGVEPDGKIARALGISRKTVVEFRQRNGIPSYSAGAGRAAPPGRGGGTKRAGARAATTKAAPALARASKLDEHLDIVGRLPDREVAARVGVTAENVRMYRLRRGISAGWRVPGAPRRGRPPKAGRSRARGSAERRGAQGTIFSVSASRKGESRTFAVLARDVGDAASRAEMLLGTGWAVDAVQKVGSVLGAWS
jgi:hypothetical protein